jgi:hypothetical protein
VEWAQRSDGVAHEFQETDGCIIESHAFAKKQKRERMDNPDMS